MNTTQSAADVLGYNAVDTSNNGIGSVDAAWLEAEGGSLAFIGVKIGMILGKTHVIPVADANIDSDNRTVQIPFTHDQVANAPTADPNDTLSTDFQDTVRSYYEGLQQPQGDVGARSVGAVPVNRGNTEPGNFPVDDTTYDLYTLITNKLQGLEAYDVYLEDAEGDDDLTNLLTQLRRQDSEAVAALQSMLVRRLGTQS